MQRKWEVLSEALKATGKYYPERLTPRLLSSRYYAGRAVIRETTEVIGNRTIQAYAALWPTNEPKWFELGTVYVGDSLRGRGLRNDIMSEAVRLASAGAKLFLITDVEGVMHSAEKLGFAAVTTQKQPNLLRWASWAGVVCRLPGSIYPIAPGVWGTPKSGERWLYWKVG